MKRKLLPFLFTLILFSSCKEDSLPENTLIGPEVTTYYFIRHAEKDRSNPDNPDPELNQRGLGRAMHWAEILKDANINAIYTTDYLRTTMTAAPTEVKYDLIRQYYDPSMLDIAQFKADTRGKNVLVVGHSNTTPEFVNKMIGEEKYPPMDDSDNGSLFIVQQIGDLTTDVRLHFNCNCPD
ncbi:Phosphohistidine phosphatase SixA [Muriicola jejuensis]|uniref:Histidine phosphatase family protein n=1 Tax=Muriicola jejuensis TaxID=504488 RepID=A0A6P0UCU6_9FLAO|nr:phosphoglycerate mutase family protein [Muriicola jejuensis]NER11085.1 histidine phosphatase family protein [Muriicola jejuensis]SMP23537.1 Phosphohistidine phosphatase SixA [Muriicola jejuensis]